MASSGSVPAPPGADSEIDVKFESVAPPSLAKPVEFILNPQVMMRRLSSTRMPAVKAEDIAAALAAAPAATPGDDKSSR
jgi:hypothetical protein